MTNWAQEEYALLLDSLRSPNSGGVLLRGPIGGGTSHMVRQAIGELEADFPILRVMCSPSLASLDYAALAPLLSLDDGVHSLSTAGLLREAIIEARARLSQRDGATRLLVVVEDADYLDAASAYILGQLVCSGLLVLLVQGFAQNTDNVILDGLSTVARLEQLSLEPLDSQGAARLIGQELGGPVTGGTVEWMHFQCAGLPDLLREFTSLLVRQGVLINTGSYWTTRGISYDTDPQSEQAMLSMARRHASPTNRLLFFLSLCGPLTRTQVDRLCPGALASLGNSELAELQELYVATTSEFFARSLRAAIDLNEQSELVQEVLAVSPGDINSMRMLCAALSCGWDPEHVDILNLARHAMAAEDYEAVTDAYTLLDVQKQQAIAELAHVCELIMDRAAPGLRGDLFEMEIYRASPATSNQDRANIGANPVDEQLHRGLKHALSLLMAGDVAGACAQADHILDNDLNSVLPASQYRLLAVAVKARALIVAGRSSEMIRLLTRFDSGGVNGRYLSHGTLSVLTAFAQCQLGKVSTARDLLQDALPELLNYDPAGVLPLALIVRGILRGTEQDSATVHVTAGDELHAEAREAWALLRRANAARERKLFFSVDIFQLRALNGQNHELNCPHFSPTTDAGIFAVSASYLAWRSTGIGQNVHRDGFAESQFPVPQECALTVVEKLLLQTVIPGDVEEQELLAQRLFEDGHVMLAIDLMAKVILALAESSGVRRRGSAIRRVHGWLHSLGEKPSGQIRYVLEKSGLTSREEEIATYIRQGLSNREIARQLTVSQRTVEGHVYRIFAKLGVTNRNELQLCY
ncbi:hypothetical protein GT020_12065 [Glutamicibacter soli]|uniref:HTH luxR-type domain-containing protein n=2 Tax=Glutamicibacter soli TaxID=453836 RepID=A0A6L9G6D9_9MICC|nr:hypothetical protein [Glutamicibacter soli]